jgi:DNA-binding transcriptional LysR family regulator
MNRPEIELRQLYVFAVVAEERHFGRAAIRLGISQPPLSQQIKKLETQIGHLLLQRDTRSVQLTEAGAVLLALARKLLEDVSEGIVRTKRAGNGEAGSLNLGFTATTALQMIPKILTASRQALPDVHIALFELLPDPLTEALDTEKVDLAIGREIIDIDKFDAVTLFKEPYVAVLPAQHRYAAAAGKLKLKTLRDENFILFPRDQASRNADKVEQMCREAGFTPRMMQQAPGWQTAVTFVGSGLGITILPSCVRSFKLPNVTYKDIETSVTSTIYLIRRGNDRRRLVDQVFRVAQKSVKSFTAIE